MAPPVISPQTVGTLYSISRTLNLQFTAEQLEALARCFELGADPDAVLRFLSERAPPMAGSEPLTPNSVASGSSAGKTTQPPQRPPFSRLGFDRN